MSPIEQFCIAIQQAGLTPPEHIIGDGEIHRFPTNGNTNDTAGAYCFYDDGFSGGWFQCWRGGIYSTWSDKSRLKTDTDRLAHSLLMDRLKLKREEFPPTATGRHFVIVSSSIT